MKPLDHYATLEAIDLARDPDFRAWILNPSPVRNQFWESVKAVYPDQQSTIEQARLLVVGLESSWQEVPETVVEASFQRLRQKQLTQQHRKLFFGPVFYRYAAVTLLVVAGLGWWLLDRSLGGIEYKTAYGEIQTLTLPDGSVVTLNANSTLSMAADWQTEDSREVRLAGEAFFDVNKKPDGKRKPFVVHTGIADVVVLGTRFNVNTRRARTQVVLEEGKVKVALAQQAEVMMQAGDMVETMNGKTATRRTSVGADRYVAWRKNLLVFENETLQGIVQRLTDEYGLRVSVTNKKLLDESFTGTVPANQPELLLRLIAEAFRLKISKQENQIVLSN